MSRALPVEHLRLDRRVAHTAFTGFSSAEWPPPECGELRFVDRSGLTSQAHDSGEALSAKSKGYSAWPPGTFDDRVLLTDKHAWAYQRVPSVSYEFTTPDEFKGVDIRLQRGLEARKTVLAPPSTAHRLAAALTTCGTPPSACGSTPACPQPRSPAVRGTASPSCSTSTRTASTGRLMPPTSGPPTPSAYRMPGKTRVRRVTATPSRHPEMAAQGKDPGRMVGVTTRIGPSVAHTAPEIRRRRTNSGRPGPAICLGRLPRWSAADDSAWTDGP